MPQSTIPQFGRIPENVTVKERPSAYAVIIDDDGLVAVVETPSGIHLPGGGVDFGETHEDAAIRETREESGLEITITGEIGRADQYGHRRVPRDHVLKKCVFYSARGVPARSSWSQPHHQLQWHRPEDVVTRFFHASHRWALERVLDNG